MDIKVPRLGEGADTGTVVNVLVSEGDEVKKDQVIIELENEKAVAPIPATASGKVTKVHVKEGDQLSVGDTILSLSESEKAEDEKAEEPQEEEREKPSEHEKPEAEEKEAEEEKEEEKKPAAAHDRPAPASPTIRRLARELGIDLSKIRGTESGGRIGMGDLRSYIARLQKLSAKPAKAAEVAAPDFSKWGSIYKRPISSLRKTISSKMVQSWTTVPHVTQFDQSDITDLMTLKKRHDKRYEEKGTRLTLTAFIIKALAPVLEQHPIFNSSIDEAASEIVFKEYHHIGLAVDTEHGLVVPVVRDANRKSMLELSQEIEQLAAKARDRKLSVDEMRGGSFTISNQGGIGGAHFTPIINVPEVAILGVGRASKQPAFRDGRVEERLMLPLCVSYDHRVIDGASAARFARDLAAALENFDEKLL